MPGQLAAQQHTLSYALGNLGGGQKSWMNPNQPAFPQPATRGGIDEQTQLPQRPSSGFTTVEHFRQLPSNSASPQLDNVVFQQLYSPVSSVLPSPTPSDDFQPDLASAVSVQSNAHAVSSTSSPHLSYIANVSNSREGQDVRQFANKRPSDNTAADPNNKRTRPSETVVQQSPTPQYTNAVPGGHQPFSPSIDSRSGNQLPSQPRSNSHSSLQVQSRTPPQGQAPYGPPHQLEQSHILRSSTTQPSPLSSTFPASPAVLSLQPLDDFYTQVHCFQMLDECIARYGADLQCFDSTRLKVLRSAVEVQDWTYLSIHQYFCLLSFDHSLVSPKIFRHPRLKSALKLLERTLDSNAKLSRSALQFFANYPLPLSQISIAWPRRYELEMNKFINIISRSDNFKPLLLECEKRGFLPLAGDLYHVLGIDSVVFQDNVFTHMLRRLWSTPSSRALPQQLQFETHTRKTLCENQKWRAQVQQRRPMDAGEDWDVQQRALEKQQWGPKFHRLCAEHGCWLLSLISQPQAQAQPLTYQQPQPVMNQQPQPIMNQQPQPVMNQQSQPQPVMNQQSQPQPVVNQRASATNQAIHNPGQVRRGPGRPHIYDTPQVHNSAGRGRPPLNPLPNPNSMQPPAGRRRPPLHSLSSATPLQPPAHVRPHPTSLYLLPSKDITRPQPVAPVPSRSALHQAHLRSPVLRARNPGAKFYQYVKDFVKAPARLKDTGKRLEKWTINIPASQYQTFARGLASGQPSQNGEPSLGIIDETSLIIRLRCIKWKHDSPMPNENAWAVAETSWIPSTYFTLNSASLEHRRKLDHGKDLPIDITSLLQEGENTLEIAVLRKANDYTYRNYILAIEMVGFMDEKTIDEACSSINYIPEAQTISEIKKKLCAGTGDDEISILESYLTINTLDPFTASTVCETPARSKACLHFDCFDLKTFLDTRKRKYDASVSDVWKCPICSGDARPHLLIVDGFLQAVRRELEQAGLLSTRAILVDQDGEWQCKADPVTRDHDGPTADKDVHTALSARNNARRNSMDFIDLSE
ncbi:hypothetical protein EJ04DRAFT_562381 [Polyplosphaeria fusca]|uniref:SP-RING-type domain-containing protein n=1 Tax=Polyplosphaeria fusca TaxID=682080 RepID=A0A9P4V5L9_9PLEO|nr:hypothetical protein EJ04DRAFT_562381 [Polyplosphaeria fusca]